MRVEGNCGRAQVEASPKPLYFLGGLIGDDTRDAVAPMDYDVPDEPSDEDFKNLAAWSRGVRDISANLA